MRETVILVPGLALGGVELAVLGWRLRRQGFDTRTFWTNPWRGNLAAKAVGLRHMLTSHGIDAPSFVGHSFGGRIVMEFLNDYPEARAGRVVTLGTPLTGCSAAQRVLTLPGGRWILGEAVTTAASRPFPSIPTGRAVGSIAGRANLLLGLWLCPRQPSDTVIGVEETWHPELAAHCVLWVSHISILVSARTASQVVEFLRTGRFSADS